MFPRLSPSPSGASPDRPRRFNLLGRALVKGKGVGRGAARQRRSASTGLPLGPRVLGDGPPQSALDGPGHPVICRHPTAERPKAQREAAQAKAEPGDRARPELIETSWINAVWP